MAKKYTDEQTKVLKNLKVSENIYKQDVRKLQATIDAGGLADEEVAKLQAKISEKTEKAAMKAAKHAEAKAQYDAEIAAQPAPAQA